MENQTIMQFSIRNVLRIQGVDILPDGTMTVISGRNGQVA